MRPRTTSMDWIRVFSAEARSMYHALDCYDRTQVVAAVETQFSAALRTPARKSSFLHNQHRMLGCRYIHQRVAG